MFDIIFALFVSFAYSGTFFFFYFTLPLFFGQRRAAFNKKSVAKSVLMLFTISFFAIILSQYIADPWWANRLQHSLGGGFAAFLAYALAMKEGGVVVSNMQYYILGFLLIVALGVANELLESVVQYQFNITMAASIVDTWLDLWSNTLGIMVAMGTVAVVRGWAD